MASAKLMLVGGTTTYGLNVDLLVLAIVYGILVVIAARTYGRMAY